MAAPSDHTHERQALLAAEVLPSHDGDGDLSSPLSSPPSPTGGAASSSSLRRPTPQQALHVRLPSTDGGDRDRAPSASSNPYEGDPRTALYTRRHWILFMLSYLGFLQGWFWVTWTPVQSLAIEVYGWSTKQFDMFINWGPGLGVVLVFFAPWFTERVGARASVTVGSVCVGIGAMMRILTTDSTWALYLTHISMILNSLAGPIVWSLPSKVSSTWYPATQRTTTTAISTMAQNIGTAVGGIAGVYTNTVIELKFYLWVQAVLGVLLIVFAWLDHLWDAEPPLPPSVSAALSHAHPHGSVERDVDVRVTPDGRSQLVASATFRQRIATARQRTAERRQGQGQSAAADDEKRQAPADLEEAALPVSLPTPPSPGRPVTPAVVAAVAAAAAADGDAATPSTLRESFVVMWQMMHDRDFVLAVLASALTVGNLGGWVAVINPELLPLGYSQSESGWISLGSTLAGLLGTVAFANTADHSLNVKQLLLWILSLGTVCFLWFGVVVALGSHSLWQLLASSSIGSFLILGATAIFFEEAVECVYPVDPVSANTLLAVFALSAQLLYVLLNSFAPDQLMPWTVGLLCALGTLMLCFFTQKNTRRVLDHRIP